MVMAIAMAMAMEMAMAMAMAMAMDMDMAMSMAMEMAREMDMDMAMALDIELFLKKGAYMKICVLDKGWVLVGRLEKDGDDYFLLDAKCIRRWGTTEGLGELALKGPLPETKLEKMPLVKFHKNQLIFTLNCEESNWK